MVRIVRVVGGGGVVGSGQSRLKGQSRQMVRMASALASLTFLVFNGRKTH
ncbi:MAG: hypothetical protein II951_12660 [Bacteroidales bacterium]|nr:hypothetical protein [Bacteroidales bacterium]